MAPFFDSTYHHIYHIDFPPRTRTRPMEVIAVGISRSGTESLREALQTLGICPVWHGYDSLLRPSSLQAWYHLQTRKWRDGSTPSTDMKLCRDDFDKVIGDQVGITDLPAATFARELIAAYPEAKVILNVRNDRQRWASSFAETLGELERDRLDWDWCKSWFSAELFWLRHFVGRKQIPEFFRGAFASNGLWVYEEHVAMVKGLGLPCNKLLEWSPEDGWEPLCQFLDKEVPERSFPEGNPSSAFAKRLEDAMKEYNDRALRNMLTFSALCLLVLALLIAL